MTSRMRRAAVILIAAMLLAGNVHAEAPPRRTNIPAAIFDVMVLRALGTFNLAVGAAAFVGSVVVSAPLGREGFDTSYSQYVVEPFDELFRRPLGEF